MAMTAPAQTETTARTLTTPTKTPVRKVQVGALAGAAVTILVYVLNTFVLTAPGQHVEAPVAAAITVLVTFGLSYLTPPGPNDVPTSPMPG
jgi:hypothetical protein